MSQETTEWFARAVVGMIWADGRIDQAEIKYLKNFLGFLQDKQLVLKVIEMVNQNAIPELRPLNIDTTQAFTIMKQLTSISIVDEELAAEEVTYLGKVASMLNLPLDIPVKLTELAKKRLGGTRFAANLMVGGDDLDVECFGFSESECMLFSNRQVNPLARLNLKLYKQSGNQNFYLPFIAEALWCRAMKSGAGKYVIKAGFNKPISIEQGASLVFASSEEDEIKKTFEPMYNCMLGYYVTCRACGEKNIPFWHLRSRTLHSKNNLFGIPVFDKAIGDKEFCDYNLYQVSICPSCLFASNQIDTFKRQDKSIGVSQFDPRRFSPHWQSSLAKRKKLVGEDNSWLYSKERELRQAIITYELAGETHRQLGLLGDDVEQANHQRKVISFLLIRAELLMTSGSRDLAKSLLITVLEKLEKIFPNLEKEGAIRAAQLFVMISIYFKEYEKVGEYLNYLNNYSKLNPVTNGSVEAKTLGVALQQTADAWQEREKLGFDSLENFHPEL
jgi:hypothetical protein